MIRSYPHIRHLFHVAVFLALATCVAACGPSKVTPLAEADAKIDPRFAAGASLYKQKCAFCHEGKNTGAIMLGRRLGEDHAQLSGRTDLDSDYVHSAVRNGLVSMPPISRVEVTDADLEKIAGYLTRNNPSDSEHSK